MAADTGVRAPEAPQGRKNRVLLCVVDESDELKVAMEYAALRARRTESRVALLYVIEQPADFHHFASIGELMREEARDEAEQRLSRAATQVQRWSGTMPMLYIREGTRSEEVIKLIAEEPDISVLVLGAAVGNTGPGPLVTALTGKSVGKLRVPVMIVPGNLSDDDLESLA